MNVVQTTQVNTLITRQLVFEEYKRISAVCPRPEDRIMSEETGEMKSGLRKLGPKEYEDELSAKELQGGDSLNNGASKDGILRQVSGGVYNVGSGVLGAGVGGVKWAATTSFSLGTGLASASYNIGTGFASSALSRLKGRPKDKND